MYTPYVPYIYIVKLVCTAVYSFFLFDPEHSLWVLKAVLTCTHNQYFEQKYFIFNKFSLENVQFLQLNKKQTVYCVGVFSYIVVCGCECSGSKVDKKGAINRCFFASENVFDFSCIHVVLTSAIRENKWAASWENGIFAYAKTKAQISFAVTAKLISAFSFATRIVLFLFFLDPKFQASSMLLRLYRPVCVGPGRKHWRPVFSRRGSNRREKYALTVSFSY